MDLRRHHGVHWAKVPKDWTTSKEVNSTTTEAKKGGFYFPEIHQLKFKLKLMKPRKWEAYFLDANIRFVL